MRKTIKLLGVFLLLAAFTNCQKDDLKETGGRHFGPDLSPYTYLYGPDALKAKEKLRAVATAKKFDTGILNGHKSDGWDIDFSEVLVMKDSIGRETYTARLTHPGMAPNQFYNLAFTENEDNTDAAVMIVRYTMTTDFAAKLKSGQASLTGYEGSITFTPVFGGQLIKPGITPVPNPVPEPATPETNNPCEEEITIQYPRPGNGGVAPAGPGTSTSPAGPGPGGPAGSDLSFTLTDCIDILYVMCSENTAGHYGGDGAECDADRKGATYLVNNCRKTVTQTKSNGGQQVVFGPCGKYIIGVLWPDYVAGVDNCNDLKVKSDNATFLAKMTEMRTGMSGTTETGYAMYATGDPYSAKQYGDPNVQNGSNVAITYDTSRDCTGYMHCHLSAADKNNYGVFSIDDLIGFGQIVSTSSAQVSTFTMYVVTVKGNFAIKIRNKAKFLEAIAELKSKHDEFQYKYDLYVRSTYSVADQIKGFLQFLESEPVFKAGTMELYKSDYNFKNWEKHALDSYTPGKINITKC